MKPMPPARTNCKPCWHTLPVTGQCTGTEKSRGMSDRLQIASLLWRQHFVPAMNCDTCAKDCGVRRAILPSGGCNDNLGETCSTCSKDCGVCAKCGDGLCNGPEHVKQARLRRLSSINDEPVAAVSSSTAPPARQNANTSLYAPHCRPNSPRRHHHRQNPV